MSFKKLVKSILIFSILTLTSSAFASGPGWLANGSHSEGTISGIATDPANNVLISVEGRHLQDARCNIRGAGNFILLRSSENYKENLALLLAAFMANKKVNLYSIDSCNTGAGGVPTPIFRTVTILK
ncbi:MAG: hypothetical protein HQK51_12255 [Oligoflexia bacterium]|nr:hypothetical protein [Oligoflexia bacterium]